MSRYVDAIYPFVIISEALALEHVVFPLTHHQVFVWSYVKTESIALAVFPMAVVETSVVSVVLSVSIGYAVLFLADIVA